MGKPPEAVENYLETILMLGYGGSRVRSVDIANEMEYSKPTISVAMKNLKASGYIEVDESGHITLTKIGKDIAQKMYERHKLISDWLMFLGVAKETALSDACKMEHDISEESFTALQKYVAEKTRSDDCGHLLAANGESVSAANILTTESVFSKIPVRSRNSHKGTYGRLLNISGSLRYRGAAVLSCMGALCSGVGICVIASTEAVCSAVAAKHPEAIFCPLAENRRGAIGSSKIDRQLGGELREAKAVLVGCGMMDGFDTERILKYVLESAKCPVVVDADGLNALARNLRLLERTSVPVILTPHPGEMGRLSGVATAEIEANRQLFALEFAKKHRACLVLKGSETLIASPRGELWVNRTGNPGLAKGGSGDVLAGIIASFAAQGLDAKDAAGCGVFLHGLAADKAAKRLGECAMLPSDLAGGLAEVFAENGR